MSNFDFLLKDFKFDTTSITYSYSHTDSLWDGDDGSGDYYFDSVTKKSLSGSEQNISNSESFSAPIRYQDYMPSR